MVKFCLSLPDHRIHSAYRIGLILIFFKLASTCLFSQANGSFEFETVRIANWPNIHSFSYAVHHPYVLLIGGRTDGLHEKKNGFEISAANNSFYLWNYETNEIINQALDSLPIELVDFFSAANAEFTQDDQYLYIEGGYGQSVFGAYKTYPIFARLEIQKLIRAILTNQNIEPAIQYIKDDTFAIAGGQLRILDSVFYLVGGHHFSGKYNDDIRQIDQRYTDSYRMFSVQNDSARFQLTTLAEIHDDFNFHRRDFNLNPIIDESGKLKLMVYSGVFQHNINRPFMNTAIIDRSSYEERFDFDHKFAAYNCARLSFFDKSLNEMHQYFLGGMAEYYRDSMNQIVRDPLVPFVKSVSCLSRKKNNQFEEFLLSEELPGYYGTNAEFLTLPNIPTVHPDIIDLNALPSGRILIGYLFGGIYNPITERNPWETDQAKKTMSNPSIIKVYFIPKINSNTNHWKDQKEIVDFEITPNPVQTNCSIHFKGPQSIQTAHIWIQDSKGCEWYSRQFNEIENNTINIKLDNFPSDQYLVRVLLNEIWISGKPIQIYR